ncbi:precorrin-8X/cobalt-precorrin-8 methylmutase [Catenibacillus scindens]|uniref:Precorrin-8X/cobalt-precorrin-8 methylmutase n=1 Tax=Catenibacillus scindens TaxID=673271 RepID=A0A7W8M6T5_9FIRM|nr:precorrin-8X methylmutase [Catenibacillus scindens]MBB5265927.1 precorrin-8X/cobalt-precorrin-8 methylmutase [Catenibacillus scindens]
MLEEIKYVKPDEIEARSMSIITGELENMGLMDDSWTEEEFLVVRRCIHTSADFDYAKNLYFSEDAVRIALEAIKGGASVITDTKMAAAGINKKRLGAFGGQVCSFMDDPKVAEIARERQITRSAVCMEQGARIPGRKIFAVGNAPTALIRLYELIKEGDVRPDLIIGVPVGFVNVVESKELICSCGVPCIVARGRKGGSNIAAAICNALIYQCK